MNRGWYVTCDLRILLTLKNVYEFEQCTLSIAVLTINNFKALKGECEGKR